MIDVRDEVIASWWCGRSARTVLRACISTHFCAFLRDESHRRHDDAEQETTSTSRWKWMNCAKWSIIPTRPSAISPKLPLSPFEVTAWQSLPQSSIIGFSDLQLSKCLRMLLWKPVSFRA